MKIRLLLAIVFIVTFATAARFLTQSGQAGNIPETNAGGIQNEVIKEDLVPNYGSLPLHFEQNSGQTAAAVKYLSRGAGYSVFLTSNEAVLALQKPTKNRRPKTDVLRMEFAGANNAPEIAGENLLEGKTNYLIGNDPEKWRTGIANFERVRYSNVYDGVDVLYYGSERQLEYDLVVRSNANPGTIALKFNNAKRITIDEQGDLVLQMAGGSVRQHKPIAYQEIGGDRKEVAVDYRVNRSHSKINDQSVGLTIGDYDHSQPLIIDPVLSYSTFLGGGAETLGTSIAVDSSGSAYVTGYTDALDFPLMGSFQPSNNGGTAGFITKLNAAGTAFVYSTYLGGNSRTFPSSIKVDGAGSAYVGGWTLSSNFPTTAGAYRTMPPSGGRPSFITKLSPSGSSLSYSTYFAGVLDLTGLALDASGNVYVTGYTQDEFFPTTPGAYKTTLGAGISQNAFVTKLNPAGSSLVYSTFVGAAVPFGGAQAIDQANAIAVDSTGNAYITGTSVSNNYPTTTGAFQIFPGGRRDAFVTKLNANGSALSYSTYLGGGGQDVGRGIAVDSSGNAYVTGSFENDDFPFTPGGFLPTSGGPFFGLAFLTKVNPSGTALIYSTALGFRSTMNGNGVAVGSDGSAYVIGNEGGGPGAYVVNAVQSASHSNDAFIVKINPEGTGLTYSSPLGGNGIANRSTVGSAIAIDSTGNALITGYTTEADFPVTAGAAQSMKPGGIANSAFVAKVGVQPTDCPAISISPQPLRVAVYNKSYIQQLTASGGTEPFTFSLAPNFGNNVLPAGLTLTPDGKIAGTPTTQTYGDYLVTVRVEDANGCVGIRTLKLVLAQREPSNPSFYVKVVARPNIRIGNEYTFFVTYANRTSAEIRDASLAITVPRDISLRLKFDQPHRSFATGGLNILVVPLPPVPAMSDLREIPFVIKLSDPARQNQTFAVVAAIPRFILPGPGVSSLNYTGADLPILDEVDGILRFNSDPEAELAFDRLNAFTPPCLLVVILSENTGGSCWCFFNPETCKGNPAPPDPYPFYTPPDENIFTDEYNAAVDAANINTRNSNDPNAKTGTVGIGAERYYSGDIELPYSVTFENVSTATAPAQDVVVTDQLDPSLFDLSTFKFNSIAFGDKQVALPTGVRQFVTDVDLRPARPSIVRVSANCDPNTGLITWQFHTIDPLTGLPPDDPNAGFLPPNQTSPEGQGTLFFTVKPRAGLATGTPIRNKARIVFDVNAPIDTAEWLNTVDSTKPVSSVLALPSTVPPTFSLRWAGTDIGSGLRNYTIYVSQDGGPYVPYLTNTVQTSAVVETVGTNHTFRFYSIATDKTGNIEPPKTVAEATTTTDASIRVTVSGRVLTPGGQGLRNALVTLIDSQGVKRTLTTSSFGVYSFDNVVPGPNYTLTVATKRFRFAPRMLPITNALTNLDFTGLE